MLRSTPKKPSPVLRQGTGIYDECPLCVDDGEYANIGDEFQRHLHGVCSLHASSLTVHTAQSLSKCESTLASSYASEFLSVHDTADMLAAIGVDSSDEEDIVEECWKEIRRASRNRGRGLGQFPVEQADLDRRTAGARRKKFRALKNSLKLKQPSSRAPTVTRQDEHDDVSICTENSESYRDNASVVGESLNERLTADIAKPQAAVAVPEEDSDDFDSFSDDDDFSLLSEEDDEASGSVEDDNHIYSTVENEYDYPPSEDPVMQTRFQRSKVVFATAADHVAQSTATAAKAVRSILKTSRGKGQKQASATAVEPQQVSPADEALSLVDVRTLPSPTLKLTVTHAWTDTQIKRRHVIQTFITSENSYVDSLRRLVYDYLQELNDANPAILSQGRINAIFGNLPAILRFHTMLRVGLLGVLARYDENEKIGDALCGFLSSSVLADAYSQYVNNFSSSMETAKKALAEKPAFEQFLKQKQISYPDRLSLYALMIKPVQRFPQFITIIQDLIKHTPLSHPDYIPVMRSLTMLEDLTAVLNYRKLVSEQRLGMLELLHSLPAATKKPLMKAIASANASPVKKGVKTIREHGREHIPRLLCTVQSLELVLTSKGLVSRLKPRSLFLFESHLICARQIEKTIDFGNCLTGPIPASSSPTTSYRVKWCHRLDEISLITERINHHPLEQRSSSTTSLASTVSSVSESAAVESGTSTSSLPALFADLSNLIHDFAILRNIGFLISALKGSYGNLNKDLIENLTSYIRERMKTINERINLMDKSRVQLVLPPQLQRSTKEYPPPIRVMFQLPDVQAKREWMEQFITARLQFEQLRVKPAWELPLAATSLLAIQPPTFLKRQCLCQSMSMKVVGQCLLHVGSSQRQAVSKYLLWLLAFDEADSSFALLIYSIVAEITDVVAKLINRIDVNLPSHDVPLDLIAFKGFVFVISKQNRLLCWNAFAETESRFGSSFKTSGAVSVICVTDDESALIVGLESGTIELWENTDNELSLRASAKHSDHRVSAICTTASHPRVFVGSAGFVYVFDLPDLRLKGSYEIADDKQGISKLLFTCGTLVVAFEQSSVLKIYDAQEFRHLQDVDVQVSIRKSFSECTSRASNDAWITTIEATVAGSLWVGTNLGIVVSFPLPRLCGFPVVNGPGLVACYGHNGAVDFLLSCRRASKCFSKPPNKTADEKTSLYDDEDEQKHVGTQTQQLSAESELVRWDSLMNLPQEAPFDFEAENDTPAMHAKLSLALSTESPIEKAQHLINNSFETMFEGAAKGSSKRTGGGLSTIAAGLTGLPLMSVATPAFANKLVQFSTRKASKDSSGQSAASGGQAKKEVSVNRNDSGYHSFTNFDNYLLQSANLSVRRKLSTQRNILFSVGSGCVYWPKQLAETASDLALKSPFLTVWELR